LICFGPGGWGLFHPDCAPWFDHKLLEGYGRPFEVHGDASFSHCVRRKWLLDPYVLRLVLDQAESAGAGPPPLELGLTLPE
jgi:hypothetical protein